MTYRQKIAAVIAFSLMAISTAVGLSVWSVKATDRHIREANLANNLLNEHLQLSVHAYRLFKQLTDEIVLGSAANQSIVRNKRQAIRRSIADIRRFELEQRAALGADRVPGAVEDTDELEQLINDIFDEFQAALLLPPGADRSQHVDAILEERIDVAFRDRVNVALERQRSVVTGMNQQIQRVHAQSVGVSVGLVIATLTLGLAMGWLLIRGIAAPLDTLRQAAETWSGGDFSHRTGSSSDAEFNRITQTFNTMAERLEQLTKQRERTESELQIAVAQRTNELSEANQALQRADSVRRQFFADVSHELRTPLTVIRGEAQVALRAKTRETQEYREALGIVLEQSIGLSRLVDDMLFIARADAERIRLNRAPIQIADLIESVVHETQNLANGRQVKIITQLDPAAPQLFADADRIQQVVTILLDNAIRFSPEQGTVRIESSSASDQLHIKVVDEGPGIDPQDLPYIFDRFFRGSSHRNEPEHGLGLGLAVAKAIVVAHGGEIHGESAAGEGTTIRINLPLRS